MLERGGFSFVALLVINPVAILLFQNCSFLPISHSEIASRDLMTQNRSISSIATPEKMDINKLKVTKPTVAECNAALENCPDSSIE